MALASQGFSQSVRRHILRRDPFNVNLAILCAFSQPVLMYINMAKAGLFISPVVFSLSQKMVGFLPGLYPICVNRRFHHIYSLAAWLKLKSSASVVDVVTQCCRAAFQSMVLCSKRQTKTPPPTTGQENPRTAMKQTQNTPVPEPSYTSSDGIEDQTPGISSYGSRRNT